MHLSEVAKIVNMGAPIDINGAGLDGAYVNLENAQHCAIIIQLGVTGAATTLTIEKDADGSGAGTAIAFDYRAETTAAGDTLDALAAATSSGIALSTNDGVFYVVEIDPKVIGGATPYVRARLSDPSAATLASMCAILTPLRYAQATPPTALVV